MNPLYPPTLLGGLALSPNSAVLPLDELLKGLDRRPRNRSEWQARFVHWQRPASETEEAKIEAVARRIGRAMRHSGFLPGRQWRVVKQGSYHNNTNVRNGSDMDLGVCLTDAFFTDGPRYDFPGLKELGRDLEQQVIDDRLVVIGDVGDRSRVKTTWK